MSQEFNDDLVAPGRPGSISMPSPGETLAEKLASLPLTSLANSFEAVLAKTDITLRSNIEVDALTLPDVSIEETETGLTQRLASRTALATDKSLFTTKSAMPNLLDKISNTGIISDDSMLVMRSFNDRNYSNKTAKTAPTVYGNPLTVASSGYDVSAFDVPPDSQDLSTILLQQRAAVIGGAIVRDIKLVLGQGKKENVKFGDVPILPLQVPGTEQAMLFSRVPEHEGDTPDFTLILPEKYISPPGFEGVEMFPDEVAINDKDREKTLQKDLLERGMKKSELQLFTVVGDIIDFWGIKGLTAKLYKYKGKFSMARYSSSLNTVLIDR